MLAFISPSYFKIRLIYTKTFLAPRFYQRIPAKYIPHLAGIYQSPLLKTA